MSSPADCICCVHWQSFAYHRSVAADIFSVGFQCMAVYAHPGSSAAAAATTSDSSSKSSKKRKHAAEPAAPAPLVRYLYYKAHAGAGAAGDDSIKAGCTLFVVNIPFFYTAEHLMQLFACFGAVEQAHFLQQGPAATLAMSLDRIGAVQPANFYRSAHVVYESEESVQMAVATDLSKMPQQCPEEADDAQNVGMKSQKHTCRGRAIEQ